MNCHDIARILNEEDVASLSSHERNEVQAHLDDCRDCTRDWLIHARLRNAAVPAVPEELRAGFASPAGDGVVRLAARRGRFVLIGMLAAVAAAAGMVIVQLDRAPEQTIDAVVASARPEPAIMALEAEEDSPAAEPAPAPSIPVPALPLTEPAKDRADDTQDPSALRLLLLPVRHESQDESARSAIDAFHASLHQALRTLPGVIVDVDPQLVTGRPVHRIAVVSPRSSAVRLPGTAHGWLVEVLLDSASRTTPGHTANVEQYVDANGLPGGRFCNASRSVDQPGDSLDVRAGGSHAQPTMCHSVEGLAEWLVAALRPPPALPAPDVVQIVARLSDASASDRHGAFAQLLERARRDGDLLDVAAIDAITAYLRDVAAEQRMVGLIQLRRLDHPGLVPLLLDFMRHDEDEKVRLEAISTLVAGFAGNARVRAAFRITAAEDPSRMVRMAAGRTLDADAQWHEYVLQTLADTGLSMEERLAPARYDAQFPGGLDGLPAYLGSERGTRILLDLFQQLRMQAGPGEAPAMPAALASRMAELGGGADSVTAGPQGSHVTVLSGQRNAGIQTVLTLLNYANPSAATELGMNILKENPRPPSWLLRHALQGLANRRDDPRAREMLEDIAAGNAGPDLRDLLAQLDPVND